MTQTWPSHPPSALEYFAALVGEDEGFALIEAAVSLGLDLDPSLDTQTVLGELDALGARLGRRLPSDAAPLHRLRVLNRFFFHELGFGLNVNDYEHPDNSYLHRVLATRRGIPITLALLYAEMAGHIGLRVQGVSFPGHFLVKLRMPAGEVILDPANGHSLSREELEQRLEPYRLQQGLVGDFDVPLGLYLQAAQPRDVMARMLGNLKKIHRDAGDLLRWLSVQHRLVLLLPEAWEERRDRALLLADLGRTDAAVQDLQVYLAHRPDAADAAMLRARLAEWRDSPRPLLH